MHAPFKCSAHIAVSLPPPPARAEAASSRERSQPGGTHPRQPFLAAKLADFGLHVKLDESRELLLRVKSTAPESPGPGRGTGVGGGAGAESPFLKGNGMSNGMFLKPDEEAGGWLVVCLLVAFVFI